jgi:hypothetical protein
MPTDLGEPFEVTWRGNPQQMLPSDVPLWNRFLDFYSGHFFRFYYNVRVGGPDVSMLDGNEAIKRMWYLNTAKRIDALAERSNDIWIIEVASSPYLRAVGQCLSYKFLWDEDPKIDKRVSTVLVCPYIDSDLERILRHYGIFICKIKKDEKPDFNPMPNP